jgi:hypothetical protein
MKTRSEMRKPSGWPALLLAGIVLIAFRPAAAQEKPGGGETAPKKPAAEARDQSKDKDSSDCEKEDPKPPLKIERDSSDCSSADKESAKGLDLSTTRPRSFSTASTSNIEKSPAAAPAATPIRSMSIPQTGEPPRQGVFDIFGMVEYRRDEIKYTGDPTLGNVFPGPVPAFTFPNPQVNSLPSAFEPNHEELTGYVSARVRDFGFERLRFDTQVSFRYWGDLDGSTEGSIFAGQLDAFRGRRILEPLTFYTDVKGYLSEDRQSRFNIRVGRQYVFGAEAVRLDGATFSINHPRFDLDVFGGRRVSFFADPEDRAVVGGNFLFRATPQTSLKYEVLHYVDNSHRFQIRHLIGESWFLEGNFFLLNDSPIDLGVTANYLPVNGKTRLTVNFLKKLTSDDFIYDYSLGAVARNPQNQIFLRFFPIPPTGIPLNGAGRLNLGLINPYTQIYVDAYRNMGQKFGVGGSAWVRHVDDSKDAGPFDTSFQELRANGDWFPSSAFEVGAEYRFRNISRENPDLATQFDDIRQEGETRFHEVYVNSAYHLFDNRVTLEGGLFYRRFDTQSRLISLEGLDTTGFTGGINWRITRNYRLNLEYGLDHELPFLNPDIDYTQSFRVRFEWRFAR